MKKMKVYLDIDGVIVNSNHRPLDHLDEFLDFVFRISNDQVFWLTTHSHDGDKNRPLEYLRPFLKLSTMDKLKGVQSAVWNTLKTEGIALEEDFLWFDDNIFNAEYKVLENIDKEYCLIKVENNLAEIIKLLREEFL